MAAETDGAVDEQAAALGLQVAQRFGGQHGNVGDQIPNSESARASSSVYGSRCSLHQEAIVIPDVEIADLAEHVDVARHRGGIAQADRNQHAPLRVELADCPK